MYNKNSKSTYLSKVAELDLAGLLMSKSVCSTISSSPGNFTGCSGTGSGVERSSGSSFFGDFFDLEGDFFARTGDFLPSLDSSDFSIEVSASTVEVSVLAAALESSLDTGLSSFVSWSVEWFLFNNLEQRTIPALLGWRVAGLPSSAGSRVQFMPDQNFIQN